MYTGAVVYVYVYNAGASARGYYAKGRINIHDMSPVERISRSRSGITPQDLMPSLLQLLAVTPVTPVKSASHVAARGTVITE